MTGSVGRNCINTPRKGGYHDLGLSKINDFKSAMSALLNSLSYIIEKNIK